MAGDPVHTQPPQTHAILLFCEGLDRALTGIAASPAWSMDAGEQRRALEALAVARARVEEVHLRVLAAADHNDVGKVDASPSTGVWLSNHTRVTRGVAIRATRLALALDSGFEATRVAMAAGRVNPEQAQAIVDMVSDLSDDIDAGERLRAEQFLIASAQEYDAKALRTLGRKILEVLDPETADAREAARLEAQEREARVRSRFTLKSNGDGTFSGAFKLPEFHAQKLKKAIEAIAAPRVTGRAGRQDEMGSQLPHPQLMGQAFGVLIEHLPTEKLPTSGGLSANIVVTTTLEQLLGADGAATLDTGGRISAAEARRLACNAGIIPMVLGGKSEPLDVGRARRLHTKAQRIAIAHRDQTCRTVGCDRPAAWCEYHHVHPWADGGSTSVKDGKLLCPWHHHHADSPDYDMHYLPDGQVRFTRRT